VGGSGFFTKGKKGSGSTDWAEKDGKPLLKKKGRKGERKQSRTALKGGTRKVEARGPLRLL